MLSNGVDIVDIAAFRAQLDDPASAFADGVFTARERRDALRRPSGDPARHLAARWAAKEAVIKAWSSRRFGLPYVLPQPDLREIEVVCDHLGRPSIQLHGALAEAIGPVELSLSLSHDGGYAVAFVVMTG